MTGGGLDVYFVGDDKDAILVDAGISCREIETRMNRLQLDMSSIRAVLISHEHSDHIGGAAACARRFDIPLYMTHGTQSGGLRNGDDLDVRIIDCQRPFLIGELEVQPFPVPHDAREPAQFVFSDGGKSLGVLTDTGVSTSHIETMLATTDALVLECNHDRDMLMNGNYPHALKQRIAGRLGHLDNHAASGLLRALRAAGESGGAGFVSPVSDSPWGFEPLCAWYAHAATSAVETVLATPGAGIGALASAVPTVRYDASSWGAPDAIFLNVNTPDDLERANAIARDTR